MALTINLTLLERKKKKDGSIPIYIRITEDRKSRYISTGISIVSKHWNPERQEIRKSHRRYQVLNRVLRAKIREVEENRDELVRKEKMDLSTLKATLSKTTDHRSLTLQLKSYRQFLSENERYWEHRHFKVVERNIKRFIEAKNKPSSMDQITSEWIEEFQKFLLNEGGPIGKNGSHTSNSPNTVRKKLKRLRGLTNWLLKSKEFKYDPFTTVSLIEKESSKAKTKLSIQQIKLIEELNLEKGSHLWHTRNYFLYSFYNAGIRFGDLCNLSWNNIIDGRLIYKMLKTGKTKSIRQLDPMNEILDFYRKTRQLKSDYIFPILDKTYDDPMELRKKISSNNVQANKRLKKIAGLAGIESDISFHVSRHSFAHYALKKGMDLYSISKALGHSDLKITEQYLKSFDEEKLDMDMEKIF